MSIHKETSIVFTDGKPMASIWSCSSYFHRRMEGLQIEGKPYEGGIMYDIPKSMVKIQLPREMSQAQRDQVRDRLSKARKLLTLKN